MKKSNVRKTISEDGWKELTKIALCGPKEIRRWKAFFPAGKSKSGRRVSFRMPRATASFKRKFGSLIMYYSLDESDMQAAKLKLTPEAYDCFSIELCDQLKGMAMLISGASKITCQVTGRLGAKRFLDDRGVVLTLHPEAIKALKLKPWRGKE